MARKKATGPAKTPASAKQERDKTKFLTFTHDETEYDVPISEKVTGRIFQELPPVIARYDKAIGVETPEIVEQFQRITDEAEKNAFAEKHQVALSQYSASMINRVTALREGSMNAEGLQAKFRYLKESIRVIIDRPNVPRETLALIDGEDIWNGDIDMEASHGHVLRFRKRMG